MAIVDQAGFPGKKNLLPETDYAVGNISGDCKIEVADITGRQRGKTKSSNLG